MKKNIIWLLAATICFASISCSHKVTSSLTAGEKQKSIVILYENDVHCGIDGYAKLAGLRDAINKSDTAYAAAVCVGDFLQGNTTGAISKGQYIIDIMKGVGYDAITLGNHEFDYGVPRQEELLRQVNAPVVCANFFEPSTPAPFYPAYVIKQYGPKRIAYVGAVTPETMVLEGYSFYDTNGIKLYDLCPETFYSLIQQAVDNARSEGADYVVLLSHVGEDTQSLGFNSHLLVNKTKGIDIVLDGHTHSIIPEDVVQNLEGKRITVTQTGTQFNYIGKLLITADSHMTTSLLPVKDIPYENAGIKAVTDSVRQLVQNATSRVVAKSDYMLVVADDQDQWIVRGEETKNDYMLVVADDQDQWIVRGEETNAGDLVADAYRQAMQSDMAFENGGGIRNNILGGTITYGSVIGMLPYDNTLCRIAATGEQIQQMLVRCTALVPQLDGNFPQCSGIRFTIHSKSHTVSDVEVLQADGTYAPIDLKKTYTVGLTDYNYSGGGLFDCFKSCPVLFESTTRYYDALANYLSDTLGGNTGTTYAKPQGRITIVND